MPATQCHPALRNVTLRRGHASLRPRHAAPNYCTLSRLQKAGWITSEPYRAVFLTPAGGKLAGASRARHKIVLDFLVAAGVPASIAHIDAEGIEHHVSPETLAVMENLAKRLRAETS